MLKCDSLVELVRFLHVKHLSYWVKFVQTSGDPYRMLSWDTNSSHTMWPIEILATSNMAASAMLLAVFFSSVSLRDNSSSTTCRDAKTTAWIYCNITTATTRLKPLISGAWKKWKTSFFPFLQLIVSKKGSWLSENLHPQNTFSKFSWKWWLL